MSCATCMKLASFSNIAQQLGALNMVTSSRFAKNSQPSSTIRCPLQIRSISFFSQNFSTTSSLQVKLTPLSFSSHFLSVVFGSLHSKSHSSPMSGTSVGLSIVKICFGYCSSGERPPCIHRIFSSTRAEIGIILNILVNYCHSLIEYTLLQLSQKP